ncbi:hypothetical protein BASA61_000126 [Batrachochytrium salamandrivorans]|nr:hypothetical protein BASA62_007805 [Batrachochytrium salamandrivorans]KAH6578661.1 hypothetical protein BASA61_000126 [Batrachochytrium salamandrivorans]KAH9246624.1 hypothetical protein BASA81_015818 [Batrachochytrium salamandrivorans]
MAHPSLIDKQAAVRPDMATLSSSLPMSFSLPSREIRFKPAIPAVRVCPATSRKNCSESMVCGGGGATPPNAMSIMAPICRNIEGASGCSKGSISFSRSPNTITNGFAAAARHQALHYSNNSNSNSSNSNSSNSNNNGGIPTTVNSGNSALNGAFLPSNLQRSALARSSASDSIVCPVPRKIHPITVAAPLEAPILYRSPHRRVQIPPVVPSWLHSNSPSTHHGRRPSYSHEHGESVNTTTGLSGVFDAVHVPTAHSVTLMKDPVMLAQRELGEILGL